MESPGDNALLAGLAAGDERAFAALYDRFAGPMYRSALAMLHRPEDAEDALQDVFVSIVRSRRQMTGVNDLRAYLFTALRRAAGRVGERRSRQPAASEAVDEVPDADRAKKDSPHGERLERALRSLPAEQREVIALKIDGQLTFAQIGRTLGVSVNTAASRYRYALEKLRTTMQVEE